MLLYGFGGDGIKMVAENIWVKNNLHFYMCHVEIFYMCSIVIFHFNEILAYILHVSSGFLIG